MSSRHILRHSALLLALMLAPQPAHALGGGALLGAVRNVASVGLPLASNIVSMIPGAQSALPYLGGAASIVGGNIAGGVGQIVSAGLAQGAQRMQQGGGFAQGGAPASFNGGTTLGGGSPFAGGAPSGVVAPPGTSLSGNALASLPPGLGGNGQPLLPGNAAIDMVDKLQDKIDDLTDKVADLEDSLADAKSKKADDEDETSDAADKVVEDDDDKSVDDEEEGLPGEDTVVK